jgi:hypothetical protein
MGPVKKGVDMKRNAMLEERSTSRNSRRRKKTFFPAAADFGSGNQAVDLS